jgi:hypothetical protein
MMSMQYIIRNSSENTVQCIMVSSRRAEVMVNNSGWKYTTRDTFKTVQEGNKKIVIETMVKER